MVSLQISQLLFPDEGWLMEDPPYFGKLPYVHHDQCSSKGEEGEFCRNINKFEISSISSCDSSLFLVHKSLYRVPTLFAFF